MIYCRQSAFALDAPDDWGRDHFRTLVNVTRADGYLSWGGTDSQPCLYVPCEEIIGISMFKSGEEKPVEVIQMPDASPPRMN